ncbi:MAG TPA: energy transducer TonB [Pyrinomonadaceae bacterium]|nr:energy transducer TonB [Pyrinomonadaceae bacterium]
MFRRRAVLFILSSLVTGNLFAQSSPQPSQLNPAFEGSIALSSPPNVHKEFVLHQIRSMVEDILSFQSPAVKAGGLSQIADIIWSHDEAYTRGLFDQALGLTAVKSDDKNARVLLYLRQDIIARIAKHDAQWAKLLIDGTLEEDNKRSAAEKRELNIETAKRLQKENPKLAAEFAARSLQGGISSEFIWFLKSLRQQNEPSANQLFLQIIHQFAQQPAVDASSFAMLGTYIFTSPRLDGSDPTSVMITRVGDLGIVDITADVQGIPPALVHAYLHTAVTFLQHPIPDPHQRKVSYALAYLLLPKARKFAPELAAPLGAAMTQLSANVPPAMTQEAAFVHINKKTVDSPEQIMSNAEKLPDAESRDVAYLDVASRAWLKKDFTTAQAACAKIANKEARSQLETLIEFGKAATKIKGNNPQLFEAAEVADKLPPGIERAVLYLGIAESAFQNKNTTLANESTAHARQAIRAVSDARKPQLLLLAAEQLARYDAVAAESAFTDVVKGFNASDGKMLSGMAWNQKVQVGELVQHFPLNVTGLDFSFNKAFRSILSVVSIDSSIAKAREFKSEQLRMSAFVGLANQLLKTLKTMPVENQSGEVVVRVGEDGMRKSAEKTVMPVYPAETIKKAQQGIAVVEAQYNGKGEVTETIVIEAAAPEIGQAVVDAVKQWKFKSSSLDGKPISVRGKLTFYFVIDKNKQGRVENPKQFQ